MNCNLNGGGGDFKSAAPCKAEMSWSLSNTKKPRSTQEIETREAETEEKVEKCPLRSTPFPPQRVKASKVAPIEKPGNQKAEQHHKAHFTAGRLTTPQNRKNETAQ